MNLIDNPKAWEAATWRPNGHHEDAYLPHPDGPEAVEERFAGLIGEGITATRLLVGEDTLLDALNQLDPGLDAYGSYIDNFLGYLRMLTMKGRLNPAAVYFAYTIFGNGAHFADVEPGAMHPSSFATWLHDGRGWILPGNKVPGGYTSAGNADAMFDAVGLGGLPHDQLPSSFIYQSAHYGAGRHICHPRVCGFRAAHSTQWANTGPNNENVDRALWLPGSLGGAPPPPPSPKGMNMIDTERNADGRLETILIRPDGAARHRWQNTAGGDWVVGWHPLGTPGKAYGVSLCRNDSGRLEAVAYLLDGRVVHTWQTGADASGHRHWQGEDPNDASKEADWFEL